MGRELALTNKSEEQVTALKFFARQEDNFNKALGKMKSLISRLEEKEPYNSNLPELRQDLAVTIEKAENNKLVFEMSNKFTPESFLIAARPQNIMKAYSKVNTAKKAIALRKISLVGINRAFNHEVSVMWLEAMLINLLKNTGITKVSDESTEFIANSLYEANKNLTTPEVVLVFARIATGQYGELYNKVTPLNICPIFDKYRTERIKAIQELESEKKKGGSMAGALIDISKAIEEAPQDSFLKQAAQKSREKGNPKLFPTKALTEAEKIADAMEKITQILKNETDEEQREKLETKYTELGVRLIELNEEK